MFVADLLADLQTRAGASLDAGNFGPALMMDQDEELTRLVACWRNVPVPVLPPGETPLPEALPPEARLRWLWSMIEPDPIPTWIRMSGLPNSPHIRRLCWVAIDNRMVHPDGSISEWASQYLSRTLAQRMGGR